MTTASQTTKQCTGCSQQLPADTEHFHRNSQARDGLHPECKRCRARGYQEYRNRVGLPVGQRQGRPSIYVKATGFLPLSDADIPTLYAEGWSLTPNALRPLCAWMKPGVGYVWSSAATSYGTPVWFAARRIEEVRIVRETKGAAVDQCEARMKAKTVWDAIQKLEGKD